MNAHKCHQCGCSINLTPVPRFAVGDSVCTWLAGDVCDYRDAVVVEIGDTLSDGDVLLLVRWTYPTPGERPTAWVSSSDTLKGPARV